MDTTGARIRLRDLLIREGFPLIWISKNCKNVSRLYYHSVMQCVGMYKDENGVAVYFDKDKAGLLAVAHERYSQSKTPSVSTAPPIPNF